MFPFKSYRDAVVALSDSRRFSVETEVLDFECDPDDPGMIRFSVKFLGQCDKSALEDGTARQEGDEHSFRGEIVNVDVALGIVLVKASESASPDPSHRLLLEPANYLKKLREFAEQCASTHNEENESRYVGLGDGLLRGGRRLADGDLGLNEMPCPEYLRASQHQAVMMAMRTELSFVWGPPGTGKSYTLGHIAARFIEQGKRVLLISNTNAAVDVATFAVDDACARCGWPLKAGDLIRYARVLARPDGYKDRPHLLEFTKLLQRFAIRERELVAKVRVLQERIATPPAGSGDASDLNFDLAAMMVELKSIGDDRRAEIARLLKDAKIVTATLTSAMYNCFVSSGSFDVVLVDEASVMSLAVWPYLLHRFRPDTTGAKFVVAGDPMQLLPVVGGNLDDKVAYWFENNIYTYLGMSGYAGIQPYMNAGVVTLLTEQTRMRAEICKVVSDRFYGGRLTGDRMDETKSWSSASGIPNGQIVLLDPGGIQPYSPRSRFSRGPIKNTNVNSALMVENLVRRLAVEVPVLGEPLEILVISPFTNQVRYLYERRLKALAHLGNLRIETTTVHRSQGSEADVVFLDLVDASAWFLNHPDAYHLWCVACSRARRQLFVLADEQALRVGQHSEPLFAAQTFTRLA